MKFPKQHETGVAEACRGDRRAGQRRRRWLGAEVSAARAVRGRCWRLYGHVSEWREAGNYRCRPKVGAARAGDVRLASGARRRRERKCRRHCRSEG
jgi:hypothetical protein